MPTIKGTYYNGRVTAGQPVDLLLEPDGMVFTNLTDTDGKAYSWDVLKIQKNDFSDPGMAVLQYGHFPAEVLEISNPGDVQVLKNHYQDKPFAKSQFSYFKKHKGLILAFLTVLFISFIATVYFLVLPKASEAAAQALPQNLEKQLGDAIVASFLSEETVSEEKTYYAQQFFNHLAPASGQEVTVTVVESGITNAYALPGGHIVVYKPIIEKCASYEEFAGLLAHENAHLAYRHSLRALFRNLSSYILLSLVFSDVNAVMAVVVENASMIHSLKYNRELEREADMHGLATLYSQGVDPEGMVKLFDKLRENNLNDKLPEFMSTHPLLNARMQYLKDEIQHRDFNAQPNDSLQYYWQLLKK